MGWEFKRFAVYYAPRPDSPLGRFGAAWLGWDADAGRGGRVAGARLACRGRAPTSWRRRATTASTATLKAPFRLAGGADPEVLDAALRDLAAECAPFHFTLELARDRWISRAGPVR